MRYDSVIELKERLRRRGQLHALAEAVGVKVAGHFAPNPPDVGVALGVGHGDRVTDYVLAVRLQRRDAAAQQYARQVSSLARGEADVQYVGPIMAPRPLRLGSLTDRQRPLTPGYSVAHFNVTAGTIGGFVASQDGYVCVLSNNHVLADSNAGEVGDDIFQPGPADSDGPKVRNHIGWLEDYVALDFSGNTMDAAVATIRKDLEYLPDYDGQPLRGVRRNVLEPDDEVWKIGRTTALTTGLVTATDLDGVVVNYGSMSCSFDGQIEIIGSDGHFSRGGDSGALVIDSGRRATALLFAGSTQGMTYASPIRPILRALGSTLLV
jgi:hypothetical protein